MKVLVRGFSLKQLLVVVAIIVALAVLVFPLISIVRYRVLETRCRANLWAILVKYKSLKEQNKGKVEWEQLEEWLFGSPETVSIRFCPLNSASGRRIPYFLNNLDALVRVTERQGNSYYARKRDLESKPDESVIAYCICHTQPIRGGCKFPLSFSEYKVLAVCDDGDGKVEYRFLYPDLFYEPQPVE